MRYWLGLAHEQFQGESRSIDHLAPTALITTAADPLAPVVQCALEAVGHVAVRIAGQILTGILEDEGCRLTHTQRE